MGGETPAAADTASLRPPTALSTNRESTGECPHRVVQRRRGSSPAPLLGAVCGVTAKPQRAS